MMEMLLKWILLALSLILTAKIIPGVKISGFISALGGVIILGLINMFIKPLIVFLTLPINLLTLGLFTFIINGFIFSLAAKIVPGFEVENFWSGVGGAIMFSILSVLVNIFIGS